MRRAWILMPLLAVCGGCYPKVYYKTFKGRAALENGKPVMIKAQLIRSCETLKGESEKIIRERQTMTDAQGNYKLTIAGSAINTTNPSSGGGCESRIQLFICRDVCKPVDEIDINVLGK